jgi:hypothetical protein
MVASTTPQALPNPVRPVAGEKARERRDGYLEWAGR